MKSSTGDFWANLRGPGDADGGDQGGVEGLDRKYMKGNPNLADHVHVHSASGMHTAHGSMGSASGMKSSSGDFWANLRGPGDADGGDEGGAQGLDRKYMKGNPNL